MTTDVDHEQHECEHDWCLAHRQCDCAYSDQFPPPRRPAAATAKTTSMTSTSDDRTDALQRLADAINQLRRADTPAARALAVRATQAALQGFRRQPTPIARIQRRKKMR